MSQILNVDPIYLARNLAGAILNISQSFHHKIGLKLHMNVEVTHNQLIFSSFSSKSPSFSVSQNEFQKALTDRNIVQFYDSSSTFIGHIHLLNENEYFKFEVTLEHLLFSMPDQQLAFTISKFLNKQ